MAVRVWDESRQPRDPGGEGGGQWVESGAEGLERAVGAYVNAIHGNQGILDAAKVLVEGGAGDTPEFDAARILMEYARSGRDRVEGRAPLTRGSVWLGRSNPKVGDVVDIPLWSFTTRPGIADSFAARARHKAGKGKLVEYRLFHPSGQSAYGLNTNKHASTMFSDEGEWLASGRVKIGLVSNDKTEWGDRKLVVYLEQEPAALTAAFDPSQPRHPKGGPEGGQWLAVGTRITHAFAQPKSGPAFGTVVEPIYRGVQHKNDVSIEWDDGTRQRRMKGEVRPTRPGEEAQYAPKAVVPPPVLRVMKGDPGFPPYFPEGVFAPSDRVAFWPKLVGHYNGSPLWKALVLKDDPSRSVFWIADPMGQPSHGVMLNAIKAAGGVFPDSTPEMHWADLDDLSGFGQEPISGGSRPEFDRVLVRHAQDIRDAQDIVAAQESLSRDYTLTPGMAAAGFDPAKHPRHPSGSVRGGEWAGSRTFWLDVRANDVAHRGEPRLGWVYYPENDALVIARQPGTSHVDIEDTVEMLYGWDDPTDPTMPDIGVDPFIETGDPLYGVTMTEDGPWGKAGIYVEGGYNEKGVGLPDEARSKLVRAFGLPVVESVQASAFDESKHRRHPAGTDAGGEFAPTHFGPGDSGFPRNFPDGVFSPTDDVVFWPMEIGANTMGTPRWHPLWKALVDRDDPSKRLFWFTDPMGAPHHEQMLPWAQRKDIMGDRPHFLSGFGWQNQWAKHNGADHPLAVVTQELTSRNGDAIAEAQRIVNEQRGPGGRDVDAEALMRIGRLPRDPVGLAASAFDPSKHPHEPGGTPVGGQWARKAEMAISEVERKALENGVFDPTADVVFWPKQFLVNERFGRGKPLWKALSSKANPDDIVFWFPGEYGGPHHSQMRRAMRPYKPWLSNEGLDIMADDPWVELVGYGDPLVNPANARFEKYDDLRPARMALSVKYAATMRDASEIVSERPELALAAAGFDATKHPRHPAGSDRGGEWAPKVLGFGDKAFAGTWSKDPDDLLYDAFDPQIVDAYLYRGIPHHSDDGLYPGEKGFRVFPEADVSVVKGGVWWKASYYEPTDELKIWVPGYMGGPHHVHVAEAMGWDASDDFSGLRDFENRMDIMGAGSGDGMTAELQWWDDDARLDNLAIARLREEMAKPSIRAQLRAAERHALGLVEDRLAASAADPFQVAWEEGQRQAETHLEGLQAAYEGALLAEGRKIVKAYRTTNLVAAGWDPTKHPREPGGSRRGGEWARKLATLSGPDWVKAVGEMTDTDRLALKEFTRAQNADKVAVVEAKGLTYDPAIKGVWLDGSKPGSTEEVAFEPDDPEVMGGEAMWKAIRHPDGQWKLWVTNRAGAPHHFTVAERLGWPTPPGFTIWPVPEGVVRKPVTKGFTGFGFRPEYESGKYEGEIAALLQRNKRTILEAQEMALAAAAEQPGGNTPSSQIIDEILFKEAVLAAVRATQLLIVSSVVLSIAEDPKLARLPVYEMLLADVNVVQSQAAFEAVSDSVNRVLLESLTEGWDVPVTAERLNTVLTDFAPWQATRLARTSLISLSNGSSLLAAQALGEDAPTFKTWLTAGDELVRPTHVQADRQTVPVDQPFDVDGVPMMFPGDPSAPDALKQNCRCTLVYGSDPHPLLAYSEDWMVPDGELALSAAFDPSKHPRHPGGSDRGGEWANTFTIENYRHGTPEWWALGKVGDDPSKVGARIEMRADPDWKAMMMVSQERGRGDPSKTNEGRAQAAYGLALEAFNAENVLVARKDGQIVGVLGYSIGQERVAGAMYRTVWGGYAGAIKGGGLPLFKGIVKIAAAEDAGLAFQSTTASDDLYDRLGVPKRLMPSGNEYLDEYFVSPEQVKMLDADMFALARERRLAADGEPWVEPDLVWLTAAGWDESRVERNPSGEHDSVESPSDGGKFRAKHGASGSPARQAAPPTTVAEASRRIAASVLALQLEGVDLVADEIRALLPSQGEYAGDTVYGAHGGASFSRMPNGTYIIEGGMMRDERWDPTRYETADEAIAAMKARLVRPELRDEVAANWAKRLKGGVIKDKAVLALFTSADARNAESAAYRDFTRTWGADRTPVVVLSEAGTKAFGKDILNAGFYDPGTGVVFVNGERVAVGLSLVERDRQPEWSTSTAVREKYDYGTRVGPMLPGKGSAGDTIDALVRHETGHAAWARMPKEWRDEFVASVPADYDTRAQLSRYAADSEEYYREFMRGGDNELFPWQGEVFAETVAATMDPAYDPADWPTWVNDLGVRIREAKP